MMMNERMMEVVSSDNWSCKTHKAPIKSPPPTNRHRTFYRPDAFLSPKATKEKKYHIRRLAHPELIWSLPYLSLTTISTPVYLW